MLKQQTTHILRWACRATCARSWPLVKISALNQHLTNTLNLSKQLIQVTTWSGIKQPRDKTLQEKPTPWLNKPLSIIGKYHLRFYLSNSFLDVLLFMQCNARMNSSRIHSSGTIQFIKFTRHLAELYGMSTVGVRLENASLENASFCLTIKNIVIFYRVDYDHENIQNNHCPLFKKKIPNWPFHLCRESWQRIQTVPWRKSHPLWPLGDWYWADT